MLVVRGDDVRHRILQIQVRGERSLGPGLSPLAFRDPRFSVRSSMKPPLLRLKASGIRLQASGLGAQGPESRFQSSGTKKVSRSSDRLCIHGSYARSVRPKL